MKEFSRIEISQGIEFICVPATRFKTNEFMISFCLPLSAETASRNALAISLLSNSSADYPDMTAIKKKLAHLYGAQLHATVQKIGENQVVSLIASSLDDRFSLGGKISSESIEMLLSLIFKPHLDENGEFFQSDIEREKRILTQKIESEENEKRTYALRKAEETMFSGEPFAVNRFGTIEAVNQITSHDVKNALSDMLSKAKIRISVVGSIDENEIVQLLKSSFADVNRMYCEPVTAVFKPVAEKVNTAVERIEVKQGKLILGFRVNMKSDDDMTSSMRAFCDVFGGGPYSKLFANVREKLSLCYYCSARYDRRKSAIIIQCGCEEENMDKAVAEILNQLEEIKNGNFDEELASSKIGLSDAINSANDDSVVLLNWYANQITDDVVKSPRESASENNAVKKEDVQHCATLLSLDTVYKLVGNKEGE